MLFWVAIGLVTSSFVLALVGEETASTTAEQTLLLWHEWIGLSSLTVLLVSFAAHALDVTAHPLFTVLTKARWNCSMERLDAVTAVLIHGIGESRSPSFPVQG